MKQRKYLITSANGYGNPGDDACGYGAAYAVKQADPGAVVKVTRPPFDVQLAEWADVIVVGGGGIIYDSDKDNVKNYMEYLEYAQEHHKLNVVLGVGVQGGPGAFTTDYGKEYYRRVLNRCDLVTVRSPLDKRQLEEAGCKRIHLTQDLGFFADRILKSYRHSLLGRLKISAPAGRKPKVGISLVDHRRPAPVSDLFVEASLYIARLEEATFPYMKEHYNVYLLNHSIDDRKWNFELAATYGFKMIDYTLPKDFAALQYAYKAVDVVITERFHPMIFASLHKKPVVTMAGWYSKHEKLADYNMPTLKKNYIEWTDYKAVDSFFEKLKQGQSLDDYLPASDEEMQQALVACEDNIRFLKKLLAEKG